ncbi:MAG: TonB-dependent receptor [Chitinophagaceae bacterium]|jgi:outer membrane receptor protein involved in Fe transport|nr:TonB-dependent receptor [Chitinophagaceae bacterium]
MRRFLCLSLFLVLVTSSFAQFPGGRQGTGAAGANMNVGHLYGKIVDSKTNKGIEGVTVQIVGNRFDTVTKKMKEAVLNTQITKSNGDFSFDNLSVMGNYKLTFSALGYKSLDQKVNFGISRPQGGAAGQTGGGFQQMAGMADKDLGNIKMEADATDLGNVTVTSTAKAQLEMGIDRKIYNVDKDLASAGQTATEIMKNIPTLNVDVDGNVTMRNAAPTIFIDGRPTTITLDQIPAEIIDKVELITNPSAKFDASGGNAGILNIVLKKNKKVGYNGGIRTGVDSRGRINLGGDINLRQNKVNTFLSANFNQRKSISTGMTDRNTISATSPSHIYNTTNGTNNGYFGFMRGGFDFLVDNRNTISVSGNYNKGQFDNESTQRVDSTVKSIFASYNQISNTSRSNFENFGTQLSYKHNFTKNGENFSSDFNFNSSNNNNNSFVNTQTYNPNNTTKGPAFLQQTTGKGTNKFYTLQADYENPLTEDSKLEFGARGAIREFANNSDQFRYDYTSNKYVLVPAISSRYKFNDQVYAGYVSYSFKVKKFSYQLGLRAESSNYTGTLLKTTGQDSAQFKVNYPLSLFPSAFITYKMDDKQDMQLNYSRRVNRPNFFQLMPFPDYSDPQNVNIGNAGLNPEFTNSFELSYNNAYKRGANFLVTAFMKYSTNLITRYSYQGPNQLNPADTNKVFYNTYINADNSIVYGLELSNRMPVTKWWDLTLSANLFSSKINATIPGQTISNNARFSWFAKMNSSFKVSKGLSIQLNGDYQAKTVLPPGGGGGRGGMGGGGGMMFGGGPQGTAQGYNLPRYGFDLSIRKDWTWKNGQSGSLSLSMNDIFRTQLFESYSESNFFTQTSSRRRDPQVLRLNFNYRFGKFDPNLFKRKNNKADQGGGMDMIPQ